MSHSPQQLLIHRARVLTQALVISGALNIGLLSAFFYTLLKENRETIFPADPVPSSLKPLFTNQEVLRAYSRASFQELVEALASEELVEDGLAKRDLALACLTAFHYFPLEKVVDSLALQRRVFSFPLSEGRVSEIVLFPGLKDEHFAAILAFSQREIWPLSTQGLFLLLQKVSGPLPDSLLEAFYVTPEFHRLQVLWQNTAPSLSALAMVEIVRCGPWETFEKVVSDPGFQLGEEQRLSEQVLTLYGLGFQSKQAIEALLQHHRDFVVKRLNDQQIFALFEFGEKDSNFLEKVARELILAPRSDLVRQKAASYLYSLAQELMVYPYDHKKVLSRFFPALVSEEAFTDDALPKHREVSVAQSPPVGPLIHTIQEGESLWKIARKYNTSIEAIMELNQLDSDRLRPSRTLKIPCEKP